MGVNTGMNQALLGNNPLATIQGVCLYRQGNRGKEISLRIEKNGLTDKKHLKLLCRNLFLLKK